MRDILKPKYLHANTPMVFPMLNTLDTMTMMHYNSNSSHIIDSQLHAGIGYLAYSIIQYELHE